jgi:GAF domain-containing protein
MAAVPILSRAGETIGVIVLHTEAPHEFDDSMLKLLVHIASLVSGAIENAQLYGQERRRVDALTGLSQLAQRVSDASGTLDLATVLATGSRRLLKADICQLLRLGPDGDTFELLASVPESLGPPAVGSASQLMLAALEGGRGQRSPGPLWPSAEVADLLVTPMAAGGERVGLLCAASLGERTFGEEDTEICRAVANLGAMAIRRLELIEGLTNANIIKDLFEALAAGATSFAAAKAAEVRCDLTTQYLMLCAEPSGRREQSSGAWRLAAEDLGRGLAELVPRCAIEAGPGPVRALLSFGQARRQSVEGLLPEFRELGQRTGAAIGVSEPRESPGDAPGAYREARDAATIAQALLRDGGAIAYSQVGAYRYLVQIGAEDAPRDRMRAAVDRLIAYDGKRRTALLDTLERYLSERRSVIESARALFIHPNTLRQRLGRIEELTGLNLDEDDLLSLELAIKLARLHGRPNPGPAAAG